jgi:hypothetical protein
VHYVVSQNQKAEMLKTRAAGPKCADKLPAGQHADKARSAVLTG